VQELWIKKKEHVINKDNNSRQTSISKAGSLEEIDEFWDTHSLADCWDQTHEVESEVQAKRKRRVTIDPEVYSQVEIHARTRGILPETLVNLWLIERLKKQQA